MKPVWIEIPVADIERAVQFYQAVFGLEAPEIHTDEVRRSSTLFNPGDGAGTGLSLNQSANFDPGDQGPLIYLDAGEDLTEQLGKVEAAGGTILESKTSMGEMGNYATIRDTEGNRLALYSFK